MEKQPLSHSTPRRSVWFPGHLKLFLVGDYRFPQLFYEHFRPAGWKGFARLAISFRRAMRAQPNTEIRGAVRSLTLKNCAISAMARCSSSRIRHTSSFCAVVRAVGLPPTRPRIRAGTRPSLMRREICSGSNWVMDAKTWEARRPNGIVVSLSTLPSFVACHSCRRIILLVFDPHPGQRC